MTVKYDKILDALREQDSAESSSEVIVSSGGSGAVNDAIVLVNAAGGGTVRLTAFIEMNDDIEVLSNVTLAGHGLGTGLRNSTANDYKITFAGAALTDYTVGISTHGNDYVTCSTAAEAGNFAVGDFILLKTVPAGIHQVGFYEVKSANAGTGVVEIFGQIPVTTTANTTIANLSTGGISYAGMDNMQVLNTSTGSIEVEITKSFNVNIDKVWFNEAYVTLDQCGAIYVNGCDFAVDDDLAFDRFIQFETFVDTVQINGNKFYGAFHGIKWGGTTAIRTVQITDNIFKGCERGIELYGSTATYTSLQNFIVSSNTFVCGESPASGGSATATGLTVYGDAWYFTVCSNASFGRINYIAEANTNNVNYNARYWTLADNAAHGTGSIYLYSPTFCNVANNNMALGGIYGYGAKDCVCSANFVRNVSFADYNVRSVEKVSITNNNCNIITLGGDSARPSIKCIVANNNANGITVSEDGYDHIFSSNRVAGNITIGSGAGDANDRILLLGNYVTGNLTFTEPNQDNCIIENNYVVGSVTRLTGTGNVEENFLHVTSYATGSSSYVVAAYDEAIFVDATTGVITVALPAVLGQSGRSLHIKKTDSSANAVTVTANGAETIDGSTTQVISNQYDAMHLICTGVEWSIS